MRHTIGHTMLAAALVASSPSHGGAQSVAPAADSIVELAVAGSADTSTTGRERTAALLLRASDAYERAGDRRRQSQLLAAAARQYQLAGRQARAAALNRRAIAIDRELGDSTSLAVDLHNLAGVLIQRARAEDSSASFYDDAHALLDEALRIRHARRDSLGVARVLWSLGLLLSDRQRLGPALERLRESGMIFAALSEDAAGKDDAARDSAASLAAEVWLVAARLARDAGRYQEALRDYDLAAQRSNNTLRLATLEAEMGLAFAALGRFDQARRYLASAKRAAEDEDTDRTDVIGLARTYLGMAELEIALGRPDSAIGHLRDGWLYVEMGSKGPDPLREDFEQLAPVAYDLLGAVGDWQLESGQPDSALLSYRYVHDRFGDRSGDIFRRLGVAHLALAQPDSAIAWLELARRSSSRSKGPEHRSLSLAALAEAHRRRGRLDVALTLLDTALGVASESGTPIAGIAALTGLARVHRAAGSPEGRRTAVAYYDSAAAITRLLGRNTLDALATMSFLERRNALYEEWVLALLALEPDVGPEAAARAALAAAEEGRGEGLKRLLGVESAVGGAPAGELETRGGRVEELAVADGSALLYYVVTEDTLLIWVRAANGRLEVARTPVARDSLAALVAGVRAALGAVEDWSSCSRTGGMDAGYREPLRRLSEVLLPPPVLLRLTGSREVLVVPNAFLATVPFAALEAGGEEPFGVRHALRHAPSVEVLTQLAPSLPASSRRLRGGLVIADPSMPTLRDICGLDEFTPGPLERMGEWAARLADSHGAEFLTGPAASEASLRERIGRASVIHLGTHAYAYSSPDLAPRSWIALATSGGDSSRFQPFASQDRPYDGMLTVLEIAGGITLSADLVVLAACQTGLGDAKRSEGVVGLPWAFLSRGASSVLASVWVVDERATVRLLDAFYRHWLADDDRPGKAEALRRAQADLWRTAHPGEWASFQLVGRN